MKSMSLADLEKKLKGHIYRNQLMLTIKTAILKFKPLAVILLGPLTEESPSHMAEAQVLFIQEREECLSSRKKKMSRLDEFGILDLSFMEATKFLRIAKEDEPYGREIIESGVVIYTKDEGAWKYICEMASIVSKFHQDQRKKVH